MALTDEQLAAAFKQTGALLQGHFLLTSGKHSDRYFQCAKVLQHPEHTTGICERFVEAFRDANVELVVSPAIGGIVVGQETARQLGARFIWAERENDKMTIRRGFDAAPGERTLVVEDVVTTGGSVFETIDAVKALGAEVVGVASVVDRSGGTVDFGAPFSAAMTMQVTAWAPEECPLCEEGVPVVKPGSRKKPA
ncbi:MAG: orotate phosphoribosyltransferase [Ignavibacteriales bacterium]|nr:orotate phosphoribosyltransferase [Ignavibacteriales bacterium]